MVGGNKSCGVRRRQNLTENSTACRVSVKGFERKCGVSPTQLAYSQLGGAQNVNLPKEQVQESLQHPRFCNNLRIPHYPE